MDTGAAARGFFSASGGVSRMTEARLGRTTLFLPVSGGEEDDTELMDGRRGLIDDADEAELAGFCLTMTRTPTPTPAQSTPSSGRHRAS